MKKLIIIAMAILSAISCTEREDELVTVKFGYSNFERGKLTKVEQEPTIDDLILSSLPTEFPLDLYDKMNNIHISAEIGKEVSIPVGEYTIRGRNEIAPSNSINVISEVPQMSIYETVKISKDINQYNLKAKFKCFAIVVDFNEISKVDVDGADIQFKRNGRYGIVYVNKFEKDFTVNVYPKDDMYNKKRSFFFSSKNVNGYVYCQEGYYYIIHPKIVDLFGTSFSIEYDSLKGKDLK